MSVKPLNIQPITVQTRYEACQFVGTRQFHWWEKRVNVPSARPH